MRLFNIMARGPTKAFILFAVFLQLHLCLSFTHNRSHPLSSGLAAEGKLDKRLDIIPRGCGEHTEMLAQLFRDIRRIIVPETLRRLERLETKLKDEPGADDEWEGIDRSTLFTFESYFDTIYSGAGHEDNASQLERLQRVKIITNLLAFALPDANTDFVDYLYCDDDFLTKDVPEDMSDVVKLEPHQLFDARPEDDGGGGLVLDMKTTCKAKGSNVLAYTYRNLYTSYGESEVLVLCPQALKRAAGNTAKLRHIRSRDLSGKHIDDVINNELFLLNTVTHELLHSTVMLGKRATVDHSYSGYAEVILLVEENPAAAIENAESFAFFMMCMTLSRYDWSTGTSQPMHEAGKLRDK